MRSKLGDSLTMALREDGTAVGIERRYWLEPNGTLGISLVVRNGTWEVHYTAFPIERPTQLCTAWQTPEVFTTCEPFALDTLAAAERLLKFGGRYWRAPWSGELPPPTAKTK
jgi:hypothetical protein